MKKELIIYKKGTGEIIADIVADGLHHGLILSKEYRVEVKDVEAIIE